MTEAFSHYPTPKVVTELNPIIRGWMNNFKIEKVIYAQILYNRLSGTINKQLCQLYSETGRDYVFLKPGVIESGALFIKYGYNRLTISETLSFQ